jgi:hypothetical protein
MATGRSRTQEIDTDFPSATDPMTGDEVCGPEWIRTRLPELV